MSEQQTDSEVFKPRILVLTTALSSYLAADSLGQLHQEYPAGVDFFKCPDPVLFPEYFYMNSFEKGIHGIVIASAGSDCPFEGAYDQLSQIVSRTKKMMKEKGMSLKQLRLTAVCSVCTAAMLREINDMNNLVQKLYKEGKLVNA